VSDPTPLPGEVAGLGRRLAAIAIDWFGSLFASLLIFRDVAYGSTESSVATLLVFASEVIVFTWLIGSSFGQRLLGIVVRRIDGSRLSLPRVIARTLLICLVVPAVVIDSQGRGLHDRLVGSVALRSGTVPT
jgi:uncharacterized RDD family membrane protein YckC